MFHAHRTLLIFLTLCLSPPMTQAMDTAALFEKTSESVVFIISSTTARDLGTGSGFAVGNGQFIVTNHHVIDKATKVTVKLSDGRELRAKVLSKDQNHDLAILGIDEALPPLSLATATPSIGQEVMAIGNPHGLERSLSTGVVSGIRRGDEDTIFYQITAPISPGSSGCPVMDDKGQVLGVATFMIPSGQNLNFAVPSKYILRMMGNADAPSNNSPSNNTRIEITTDDDGTIVIGQ